MLQNLPEAHSQGLVTGVSKPVRITEAFTTRLTSLDFHLPASLEANEPPEARGLSRDQVRLMVSNATNNHIAHTQFRRLPDFLDPGDLLVINTSGTRNAACKCA